MSSGKNQRSLAVVLTLLVAAVSCRSAAGKTSTSTGTAADILDCPQQCRCYVPPESPVAGIAVSCSDADLTSLPARLPANATLLDFSGNRLDSLTAAVLLPLTSTPLAAQLTNANFSRNRLESIDTGAFSDWRRLESLDLSANRLSTVDHGTFRGGMLATLQNLDLSGNRLTDIDGGFSGMTSLFRLDLRNNYITSLTEFTFRDLAGLRYLHLTNNRIYRVDRRTFRSLENLLYLVLRGNPLHEVDQFQFSAPSSLSYVDLSECGLINMPRGLPASLRYVQLRRNNITTLDAATFSECPDANIVVLDENRIENIANGTFRAMKHLQQLWLNDNRLTSLPRPLPVSLRRLLADNNRIRSLDADTFPVRSQLSSVSLVGNEIANIAPEALRRLASLHSLDLSNNQLTVVGDQLLAGNTQLRSLGLSKNPLQRLDADAFAALRSLKSLSIGYVPTDDVTLGAGLFRSTTRLSQLDVDNSPAVAAALLDPTADHLDSLASVDELGLANCDLTSLPADFRRRLPRLATLRLAGNKWHCDASIVWLRDWLRDSSDPVRIDGKTDVLCASPASVAGRSLASLDDSEFASTTATMPPRLTSSKSTARNRVTSSTVTPSSTSRLPVSSVLPSSSTVSRSTAAATEPTRSTIPVAFYDDGDYLPDYSGDYPIDDVGKSSTPSTTTVIKYSVDWRANDTASLSFVNVPGDDRGHTSSSAATAPTGSGHIVADGDNTRASPMAIQTGNDEGDVDREAEEDRKLASFKLRVIIAMATVGATLIVAAFIVAGIVYVCRSRHDNRKSPTPGGSDEGARTFIKYKHKNGVLYFSTPVDPASNGAGSAADTCVVGQTLVGPCVAVNGDEAAAGTPRSPSTPGSLQQTQLVLTSPPPPMSAGYKTRVYRWEDF